MTEAWTRVFKSLVALEIEAANGKKSDGYRAVAGRTLLGYAYIYQIYNDKPKNNPKRPSADAMSTVLRVYKDSEDEKIRDLLRNFDDPQTDSRKQWPFRSIDLQKVMGLRPEPFMRLERAILMQANILDIDIMSEGAAQETDGFE